MPKGVGYSKAAVKKAHKTKAKNAAAALKSFGPLMGGHGGGSITRADCYVKGKRVPCRGYSNPNRYRIKKK